MPHRDDPRPEHEEAGEVAADARCASFAETGAPGTSPAGAPGNERSGVSWQLSGA